MTKYRELLDPNSTLPLVRLDIIDSRDYSFFTREDMSIVQEEEPIGHLTLVSERHDESRFAHFDGIEIAEGERGRGAGLAAYILAIELSHARGYAFESQNSFLTQYSKKVWEHLASNAIAEVVRPFQEISLRPGSYDGKYAVPLKKEN